MVFQNIHVVHLYHPGPLQSWQIYTSLYRYITLIYSYFRTRVCFIVDIVLVRKFHYPSSLSFLWKP